MFRVVFGWCVWDTCAVTLQADTSSEDLRDEIVEVRSSWNLYGDVYLGLAILVCGGRPAPNNLGGRSRNVSDDYGSDCMGLLQAKAG